MVVAAFYGSLFYHVQGGNYASAYTNRMSVLFFSLSFLAQSHQQTIPASFEDRYIYIRERAAGAYGTFGHWFALWFLHIPFNSLNVLLYSIILYKLVGFNDKPGCFPYLYGVMLLTSWTGFFMCQFWAAISPSPQVAISRLPISLFFAMVFAGYIVAIPSLNSWLAAWAPYISFLRFPFQGLVINEFTDNNALPDGELYIDVWGFQDYTKRQCGAADLVFLLFFAIGMFLAIHFTRIY